MVDAALMPAEVGADKRSDPVPWCIRILTRVLSKLVQG